MNNGRIFNLIKPGTVSFADMALYSGNGFYGYKIAHYSAELDRQDDFSSRMSGFNEFVRFNGFFQGQQLADVRL